MSAYISDAKRERARWMTFAEAVAHVAKHEGCDRDCAEQQLRDALSGLKLLPRWEDKPIAATPRRIQPSGHGGSEANPTPILDLPPDDPRFWQRTPIREGIVLDPYTRRGRRLLLLRFAVNQIWKAFVSPLPEASRSKGGRPSKIEKVKKLLSGVDLTVADATRRVQACWPASEGPPPSAKTIKRAVDQMLGDKTRRKGKT